jgi:hypothetical protein
MYKTSLLSITSPNLGKQRQHGQKFKTSPIDKTFLAYIAVKVLDHLASAKVKSKITGALGS